MAEDEKGELPYGWIVRASKKYPDRIYYFNTISGNSTWECPQLEYPAPAIHKQENERKRKAEKMSTESVIQKLSIRTAVVAPVIANKKKSNSLSVSKDTTANNFYPTKLKENPHKKTKISSDTSSISVSTTSNSEVDMPIDSEGYASLDSDLSLIEDIEMLDVSSELTRIEELRTSPITSYYIVVDTNVFISELNQIDELKDTPIKGCGPPHIFIPWIVIQELDSLKNTLNDTTRILARKAVRYLHSVLKSKHPRFHGQSPKEVEDWAKSYSKCNDDRLLECCTSLAQKMPKEKIILLTNDKNLFNKASICDIVCHDWQSMSKYWKPDVNIKIQSTSMNSKKIQKNAKKKENKLNNLLKRNPENLSQQQKYRMQEKIVSYRANCKREINVFMCEARQILKEVLYQFFTWAMDDAYGEVWKHFNINTKVLKGLLGAYLKYWRMVFSFHFSDREHRHCEQLQEMARRPEGFLVDEDECLTSLTVIEDILCKIKRKCPEFDIPLERVQSIRTQCKEIFSRDRGLESSYSNVTTSALEIETSAVLTAFERNWTTINHLCGMVLDFCKLTHDISYNPPAEIPGPDDFHQLMSSLYPGVQNLHQAMSSLINEMEIGKPTKQPSKRLFKALTEFIPSLNIQLENPPLRNFSSKALERYCTNLDNRERIRLGYKQLENYFAKLEQALSMMNPNRTYSSFTSVQT